LLKYKVSRYFFAYESIGKKKERGLVKIGMIVMVVVMAIKLWFF